MARKKSAEPKKAKRQNPIDPATGKRKIGRPQEYNLDCAIKCDVILDRLAKGEALRNLLAEQELSPGTFFYWVDKNHDDLSERYASARQQNAIVKIDEAERIADDGTNDFMNTVNLDGDVRNVFRPEHVKRSDLRVKFRMWYAEKVLSGALNYRKPESSDNNSSAVRDEVISMLDNLAAIKTSMAKKAT